MIPRTQRRRRALYALALVVATTALCAATAVAAHGAEPTVEKSVPIKIYVSGTQHTEWHLHSESADGCTEGTAVLDASGSEDLGFKAPDRVLGTMSTLRDDQGFLSTRIDLDPVDPLGVLIRTDANTHRTSQLTWTVVGGHESWCGGSDEDPEPPVEPDCGTKEHALWVRLTMDEGGKLGVASYDNYNKDPFKRCATSALYASPKLLPVLDGTETTITGAGDDRVATIVGRRTFHQPLPGGEAVTTIRWRAVLARYEPDREDEELRAPTLAPAIADTVPAPVATAPVAPAATTPTRTSGAPLALRHARQPRSRAHRRTHARHPKPPRRS